MSSHARAQWSAIEHMTPILGDMFACFNTHGIWQHTNNETAESIKIGPSLSVQRTANLTRNPSNEDKNSLPQDAAALARCCCRFGPAGSGHRFLRRTRHIFLRHYLEVRRRHQWHKRPRPDQRTGHLAHEPRQVSFHAAGYTGRSFPHTALSSRWLPRGLPSFNHMPTAASAGPGR